MLKILYALICTFIVTGCSTTSVGLKYAPGAGVAKVGASASPITVGTFADQRGEPANWLGAIRGGYGNPLKIIESDQPVSSIVQAAFTDGLRVRGVKTDVPSAPLQLSGVIRVLDCNQLIRREANVEIEVLVTDNASGQQRFSRTYVGSNVDGSLLTMKAGVFGSVEDLRALTEKTLREVVDKALDDPALRAALRL
jgi:uncharacterized lipoprotein YajG